MMKDFILPLLFVLVSHQRWGIDDYLSYIGENLVLESKRNLSAEVFNIHINDAKKFRITDVKICTNNINYSRINIQGKKDMCRRTVKKGRGILTT